MVKFEMIGNYAKGKPPVYHLSFCVFPVLLRRDIRNMAFYQKLANA